MGKRPGRVKPRKSYKRKNSTDRGYNYKWQKVSRNFRLAQPACNECGVVESLNNMVVDHIIPHRGDMQIFWDPNNWQSLCRTCHNKKTARGE